MAAEAQELVELKHWNPEDRIPITIVTGFLGCAPPFSALTRES